MMEIITIAGIAYEVWLGEKFTDPGHGVLDYENNCIYLGVDRKRDMDNCKVNQARLQLFLAGLRCINLNKP